MHSPNSEKESNEKVIDDPRLIAGYLRDSVFQKSPFVIRFEHLVINARLFDISEKSARDRSSERSLVFSVDSEDVLDALRGQVPGGAVLKIAVAADRMLFKFNSRFLKGENSILEVSIPVEATIITSRQSYRFQADQLSPGACAVCVSKEGSASQFGTFQISDVSDEGIGGILTLPKGTPISQKDRVVGKLLQQSGALVINGQISWFNKISSGREEVYRMGVTSRNQARHLSKEQMEGKERRRRPRLRAELVIEAISPLFPRSPAVLQVEDISLQGLRARFLNLADRALFHPNLELTMTNPRLRLQVVNISRHRVAFKILRSAIEEHIHLFNLQSFLGERDLASGTPMPGDIAQIYTTSGAFSTALARNLSVHRDHLLKSNAGVAGTSQWFLRWLQQATDGRLRAAILTAPFSDHVWYLGGLAGHLDMDLKLGNDFIARYFRALHGFLGSIGSREYIFFNWFETNSRWNEWGKALEKYPARADLFQFTGDIVYLNDRSLLPSATGLKTWERVGQGEVGKAEELISEIEPQSLRRLFTALGLNPFTFGAPVVSELLRRTGYHFSREFYRLKLGDATVVVMLSTFPDYVFMNGIINYPFVYSSRQLARTELDILAAELSRLCVEAGIDLPAYFLTCRGEKSDASETSAQLLRAVKWTFGPPEILDFWGSSCE